MTPGVTARDWLDLYEGGKHRRYSLLFAVNGGAFAVAKLLAGGEGEGEAVLGGLTLSHLALGMVLFSAVMVMDIYFFGMKMRDTLAREGAPSVFGTPGKIVLLLLGLLLVAGWLLAGFAAPPGG